MSTNIIDSVSLTPAAVEAWKQTSREQIARLKAEGVGRDGAVIVSDEEAYAQADGTLQIQCSVLDKYTHRRVVLSLPATEWTMAN